MLLSRHSRGFHIFFFVVSSTLSASAISSDIPALCMRYHIQKPMILFVNRLRQDLGTLLRLVAVKCIVTQHTIRNLKCAGYDWKFTWTHSRVKCKSICLITLFHWLIKDDHLDVKKSYY
eukprot:987366_1